MLRRRPDIRRAEREVAAQSARIGIAAADLFPAFTINGSINWQANTFGDMFSPAANAGFINPGFNWNILNYGRIRNNIRAQDAKFQELAIQYQEIVLKSNTEVEDAIVSFLKAQDQTRSLREGEGGDLAMCCEWDTKKGLGTARLIAYTRASPGRYERIETTLVERHHSDAELRAALVEAGFDRIRPRLWSPGWEQSPKASRERTLWTARVPGKRDARA